MKCSDFIAEFLRSNGIEVVFDFTGGMIACLENSISNLPGINCLPSRHEQGSAFAAEGYSRINKNFGVAIATSGPGATNMITTIGSCYFDSIPVLFFTGQVNTKELRNNKNIRQNGFQELNIIEIVKSITKYNKLILNPNDVLYELEKSLFFMKNGRPGPVLIDIPFNVQIANVDSKNLRKFINSKEHIKIIKKKTTSSFNFAQFKKLLASSKKPIVLFGNGVKLSKTEHELKDFLNNNFLPSVGSLMGLGVIPSNQNNYLGLIGTYGNRSANIALANADLIIVLGSRLDLRQTGNPKLFAANADIFHLDIDSFSRKKDFEKYFFVKESLNIFFNNIKNLKVPAKQRWLTFIDRIKNDFSNDYTERCNYCNPNLFFKYLSNNVPKRSTVIADVGQNQMWLAQSWKIKNEQKLIFSGGMGAMGFSLPVSIGAYFADKSRGVYSFMGDGGFQINMQELETIKHNNIPIKIFILNNNSLGMVREFQDQYFNSNHQSTVIGYSCPNIKKIANAYGIRYFRVNKANNVELYKKIISIKSPIIIEVVLDQYSELKPKVVYGEFIENQYPFLSEDKKILLDRIKKEVLK